jgi:hypothetical protein
MMTNNYEQESFPPSVIHCHSCFFLELLGLSPNFRTHVSVSDLYIYIYIYVFGPHIVIFGCSKIDRPIVVIYKSLTDIHMSEGTGRENIIILFWK